MTIYFRLLFAALLLTVGGQRPSVAAVVTVHVETPGAQINPDMWGVFFEDINFGADGGLYAELIKNRSFEFPQALTGWSIPADTAESTHASVKMEATAPSSNSHFLRLESKGGAAAIENEGFRGVGVQAGKTYDFSVRLRGVGMPALRIDLVAPSGAILSTARLAGLGADWIERKGSLVAQHTESRARLRLVLEGEGSLDLDRVSFFPRETWRQRAGGLRADMVQALADLKPGFLRFPGGCIVEGSRLELRYQWKKTIGSVDERQLLFNRWNDQFKHRPAPDYFQSMGLGFFEYFVLCEDIGAEPLPILNCGMACQFNSGELVPLDQLDSYIQDALDLIEFANGAVTTEWGAKRAAMGHPEPFHLKMLGVGNEQWGPEYIERYALFSERLRAKHPEIALVAGAGPGPEDERFHYAWPKLRELKADFVDEHCYAKPEWFLDNARRYDKYDRNGPKVFMGEYAAQSVAVVSPENKNTWGCAMAEAAFMTGMERNADIVRLAAYAPLFAHVDAWQWSPNLIWVDNLRTLRTPSYHVQSLFGNHRGDRVVPVTLASLTPDEERRLYVSSTIDEASGEVIVKIVNALPTQVSPTIELSGVARIHRATQILVQSNDLDAVNSFEAPQRVAPRESVFSPAGTKFDLSLPPYSFSVIRAGISRTSSVQK